MVDQCQRLMIKLTSQIKLAKSAEYDWGVEREMSEKMKSTPISITAGGYKRSWNRWMLMGPMITTCLVQLNTISFFAF